MHDIDRLTAYIAWQVFVMRRSMARNWVNAESQVKCSAISGPTKYRVDSELTSSPAAGKGSANSHIQPSGTRQCEPTVCLHVCVDRSL